MLFALLDRRRFGQLKFLRQVPAHFIFDNFLQSDIGHSQASVFDEGPTASPRPRVELADPP